LAGKVDKMRDRRAADFSLKRANPFPCKDT